MEPEYSSKSHTHRKVYRRGSEIAIAIYAAFLLILMFFLRAPVLMKILFSGVTIFLAYAAGQIRLVISADRIEYYQVGYSVRTTWDNIAQIVKIPAGHVMAEGLILNKPALSVSKWLSRVKYIQTRGQLIPLSLFKRDWRNSEIGQEIKKYAPHLFI